MPAQPDWMDAIEHEARALVAWVDIGGEARSFFDGSISAERYAANLVQLYHYVRWSSSLLEQAGGTIPNIRKAVTFLRGHAGEDVDHVAELEKVLRSLTDPGEQVALILSARTTRAFFQGIFSTPGAPVRNVE